MAEFYIARDNTEDLSHYGIIGMHWGVRRFQNPDGTYTQAGLDRYFSDREARADHDLAFDIGKKATITGKALVKAATKSNAAAEKLERAKASGDPKKIARLQKKADMAQKVTDTIRKNYDDLVNAGEEHVEKLMEKYGKENVKGLNYVEVKNKQNGVPEKIVVERTVSGADIASSVAKTAITNVVLRLAGVPAAVIYTPASANQQGNAMYRKTKKDIKKEQKQADKEAKIAAKNNMNKISDDESVFASNGKFTDSYKKFAMDDAKKGSYNLEFLERIQNKTYLSGNDEESRRKRNREYRKFLNSDSPMSYHPPEGDEE